MAEHLGLTKGAVSQTLSRLENKGIVKKIKDPFNKNELSLSLTSMGERAYELCKKTQKLLIRTLEKHLESNSQEEKRVISKFLFHLEGAVDGLDLS